MAKARLRTHPFTVEDKLWVSFRLSRHETLSTQQQAVCRSRKPLNGDDLDTRTQRIASRKNDRCVIYIDTANRAHVVLPDPQGGGIPYPIEVLAPRGQSVSTGYWLSTIPVAQPSGQALQVQLVRPVESADTIAREIEAVYYYFDLATDGPTATLTDLNAFDAVVRVQSEAVIDARVGTLPGACGTRYDIRDRLIYTIDGPSTKDIDDAIEVQELEPGSRYLLGVHIADVTEFIRGDTPPDLDARSRATSLYPADRVVHMLPTELSQGHCSLNPNEDRLAFSVYMDVLVDGDTVRVSDQVFFNSLIHSQHRLTYAAVNSILAKAPDAADPLDSSLRVAMRLARLLAGNTVSEGSGNVKYSVSDRGVTRSASATTDADRLIEHLMISANKMAGRVIADAMGAMGRTGIAAYRVQDSPRSDNIVEYHKKLRRNGVLADYDLAGRLAHFEGESATAVGGKLTERERRLWTNSAVFKEINASIPSAGDDRVRLRRRVLEFLSPPNVGYMTTGAQVSEDIGGTFHHGLGTHRYAWFTSPIRRYTDVVNHRTLKHAIGVAGRPPEVDVQAISDKLRKAKSAETALNQRLLAFYLVDGERITESPHVDLVLSFFRHLHPRRIMVTGLWSGRSDVYPLSFISSIDPGMSSITDDGLTCSLALGTSRHTFRIGDTVRVHMAPGRGQAVFDPNLGYIVLRISDLESREGV